jgi:hypothetical protein
MLSLDEKTLKSIDDRIKSIGSGSSRSGYVRDLVLKCEGGDLVGIEEKYLAAIDHLREKQRPPMSRVEWINRAMEKLLKIELGFNYFKHVK